MTVPKSPLLQIGEVANRAQTTIRTVRYYLQQDLIDAAERSPGGFYLFSDSAVDKVRYICHLRELGLSLRNIKDLIRIRRESGEGGQASLLLRTRLQEQLAFTEKKIQEFTDLKGEIAATIRVLKRCAECKSEPRRAVCEKCGVLSDGGALPAPMKAVY